MSTRTYRKNVFVKALVLALLVAFAPSTLAGTAIVPDVIELNGLHDLVIEPNGLGDLVIEPNGAVWAPPPAR